MRLALLFALLAWACGSSEQGGGPRAPSEAEEETGSRSCDERIAAFEARLALAPPDLGAFMEPPSGARVPHGHGEPLRSLGPAATILRDGAMLFDGDAIAQAALQPRLDQSRRNWALLHPRDPFPGTFFAWVDPDVKVRDAHELLQSDQAWLLLLEDPSLRVDAPACPPSLGEQRCQQFMEPSNHVSRLRITRELWSRGVGECRELLTMFDSIAQASIGEKSAILRRDMPVALRQCDCNADVDTLEYVTLTIFALGAPAIRTIQVGEAASPDQTIGEYVAAASAR